MSEPPPETFSYEEVTPLIPGRAEDHLKRLGFRRPFLSAVAFRDALASEELPPLRVAREVASLSQAMKWPFYDIREVVHDYPLPDYAPLLETIAKVIAPLPPPDQLEILSKSLSLCFHACSEAGVAHHETRKAVVDLIGSLSVALGTTRPVLGPPTGPPPAPPVPTRDTTAKPLQYVDDVRPLPKPQLDEPAPPGPAPKKGKGKGKPKPLTVIAPIPTAQPNKATPPHLPRPTSYAAAMAQPPKPKPVTWPSLVISLRNSTLASNLKAQAKLRAPSLVEACNEALQTDVQHANVRVSAAKWAPSGNLVVFAGPDTNLTQLQSSHHIITSAVEAALPESTSGKPSHSSRR